MKIIELIGLPGAGKSSTANKLVESLREKGHYVPDLPSIHKMLLNHNSVYKRLVGIFKRPLLVIMSSFCFLGASNSIFADLRKVLYTLKMYQYYTDLSKLKYDFVVNDQGYYLSLLEYFCRYYVEDSKKIESIFRNFYSKFNIEIIYFYGDLNECVNRVMNRDKIDIDSKRINLGQTINNYHLLNQYLSNSITIMNNISNVKYIDLKDSIDYKCIEILECLNVCGE